MTDPKPGQLWRWMFALGEGWWPMQPVTSEGRISPAVAGFIFLKSGDVFTVVTLDDPGPYELHVPSLDNYYKPASMSPFKRWHVVLVGDKLVWFSHALFAQAELLSDVE